MNRSLSIVLLATVLVACGGSGGGSPSGGTADNGGSGDAAANHGAGLDPAAISLETPPTDGKLPADLIPPG